MQFGPRWKALGYVVVEAVVMLLAAAFAIGLTLYFQSIAD